MPFFQIKGIYHLIIVEESGGFVVRIWKEKNEFLFIGAIGDHEITTELNRKRCNISTGYNVQRKMIDGLEKQNYYSDTISAYASPPEWWKNLFINYKIRNRNSKVTDVAVKFINIPLLDKLIKGKEISKYAKEWVKGQDAPYIFIYALCSHLIKGAVHAKRKNPCCKIISIVPDLPEYMSNSQNKIYRFLKAIDRIVINHYLKEIDGFVLFAEPMKEKLDIAHKPFVVVEGIMKDIDKESYIKSISERKNSIKKIIMISGNLDKEEGIGVLLNAFEQIPNNDYSLWITGSGNYIEKIKEHEKRDARIKYYGYIDSYHDFLSLQQKATLFVLMVSKEHPKSAYYFPSKIMEYLATGGQVACFKLRGIPDEYDNYLEYFPENIDGVVKKIIELCEMEPEVIYQRALERYEFLKTKSPEMQMNKVVSLIKIIK